MIGLKLMKKGNRIEKVDDLIAESWSKDGWVEIDAKTGKQVRKNQVDEKLLLMQENEKLKGDLDAALRENEKLKEALEAAQGEQEKQQDEKPKNSKSAK